MLSEESAATCRSSNRTRIWGFTVGDFARVLGETEITVRRKIGCDDYDPSTLEGIAKMLKGQV